jgi:fatty acid desaturase
LSPAQPHERASRLEPVLGRSLAETQRLNDPRQHAAREAAGTVQRRVAERRQARPGRRLGLAMAALVALLGSIAALLWLLEG